MINLTKQGSSLVVKSDDANVFPFKNGTISLPMNSLYIVIDGSDYVSFKQAQDNNQIFGTEISKIQINGTKATKENIITLFDSVANAISQGGGGGGGAVDSVNGQTGTVILTPQNIGTYTSEEIDGKLGEKQDVLVSGTNIKTINSQSLLGEGNIEIQTEGGGITDAPNDGKLYGRKSEQWSEVIIPDTSNLATKTEIPTKVSQLTNDSNYITEEQASESYQPKGDYLTATAANEAYQAKGDYITTETADSKYQKKGDYALASAIPTNVSQLANDSNYITEEEATSQFAASADLEGKQDVLVSGTNIKTINGASILGEGNISIETPEGGISDAPKDGNTYARRDGAWTSIIIPSLEGYITETEADGKYQPKGDYLTEVPSEYVTDSELNGKGYLTSTVASETYQPIGDYALKSEIPSTANLVTTEELNEAISGKANTSDLSNYLTKTDASNDYADKSSLEELKTSKLDVSTYNQDKATFALKSEIPTDYLTDADLTDYLTKDEASDTYREKKIINFNRTNTSTEITNAWANSLNNIGATFQYVSFDEGATYNNVLYCGYRSYDGAGNRKGVGITEIDGKMRSVIFEFSGTDCVATLEDDIDLSNYATTEQLNSKQDTLVSGTNIKTINNQSLLGSGNISIEGGGITDAPSDDKTYGRKNGAWSEITEQDLSDYALKSEVPKEYVQAISFLAPTSINIFDQEGNMKMISFADGITLGENGENVEIKLDNSFVEKVDAKQDALTAGSGISIQGSTISTTLSKEWFGTSAQYAEVEQKDENTLYYITDDTTE